MKLVNLMGSGIPSLPAQATIGGVSANNTATGTGQFDGFPIASTNTHFTTVAAGSGAFLPANASPGDNYRVYNRGANALLIWPASGVGIGAGAANASYSLAATKAAWFTCITPTLWDVNLSA
jgi:hypothetical protein